VTEAEQSRRYWVRGCTEQGARRMAEPRVCEFGENRLESHGRCSGDAAPYRAGGSHQTMDNHLVSRAEAR
jgi:hypothetical protein